MIHDRNIQVSPNKNFNQVMMQVVIDFQNNYSSNYHQNRSLNQFKEAYETWKNLKCIRIWYWYQKNINIEKSKLLINLVLIMITRVIKCRDHPWNMRLLKINMIVEFSNDKRCNFSHPSIPNSTRKTFIKIFTKHIMK